MTSMARGALWPIVLGAAVCLAGCAARRPTRATVHPCVERVVADRRACFRDCEGAFEQAFVGCYGGPNTCTERCETQQLVCQAGPLRTLNLCGESAENPRSCQAQLRADQQGCAGRPDRAACEEDARHRAAACWQMCRGAQDPALKRCAVAFKTCLDGCVPR
jgi:hypothetical protein